MTPIANKTKLDQLGTRLDNLERIMWDIRNSLESQNPECWGTNASRETCEIVSPNITSTESAKILSVLKDFNFKKVHKVMEMLDWKWAVTYNGGSGVPSMDDLKKEAKRLLVAAVEEKTCVASGGFRAIYEKDGDTDIDPYIGLEFIIEECEGFEDDEDDSNDEWENGDD